MKLFVAGKIGDEEQAKAAMKLIREAGHEITFDWTTIPHLKPYEQNQEASMQAAIQEAKGVARADAVILLAHENGRGMYVELGMALANKKTVFVIGEEDTSTMFLFHPLVRRVKTVSEALSLLNKSRVGTS